MFNYKAYMYDTLLSTETGVIVMVGVCMCLLVRLLVGVSRMDRPAKVKADTRKYKHN